jgi:hypothetical protein
MSAKTARDERAAPRNSTRTTRSAVTRACPRTACAGARRERGGRDGLDGRGVCFVQTKGGSSRARSGGVFTLIKELQAAFQAVS